VSRAETDGKVVRTLVKLTLFRQFYIMVRWKGLLLAAACGWAVAAVDGFEWG